MIKYVCIVVFSGILSSFAQVLLKRSAINAINKKRHFIFEYLNIRVLLSYGITFFCMFLVIIAFRGIPYKLGSVLESLAYLYIMVLSKIFLKEKITRRKLVGNLIIVAGIIIFNLK